MAEKKQKDLKDMTNKELLKVMSGPSQLKRKNAAKILAVKVKENPESFKSAIPDFVDALARPEAQTRWEALDALTFLVPVDAKACKAAIEGAEEALFDEKTSLIRESAVRFLSRYGASSTVRSKEVWPLIKEALQQFHGEIEYDKILNRINFFAAGKLDASVKKDLRSTARDISKSVGGPTKARLERILLSTQGKTMKPPVKKAASKKVEKKAPAKKAVAKKAAAKKPVAKKAPAKKTAPKKAASKKPATKKIEQKKKEVQKKVVKKAVKTAVAKPKAKTAVGKKVEKKKKKVAKKIVKKTVKRAVRNKIKKAIRPKKKAKK